jgi:hypothetical protein
MEIVGFFTEFIRRVDAVEVTRTIARSYGTTVSGIKSMPVKYTMQ